MSKRRTHADLDTSYIIKHLRTRVSNTTLMSMFADEIERMNKTHISTFPNQLLAHVLSFIELGDVKAVSIVCKQWNVVFKLPSFWTRHIARKVNNPLFNNFFFSDRETFREQTEWLFRPTSLSCWTYTDDSTYLRIARTSKPGWAVRWTNDDDMYQYHEYTSSKAVRDGLCFIVDLKPIIPTYEWMRVTQHFHKDCVVYRQPFLDISCKKTDGSVWVGDGCNSETVYPHGKGTWTFSNGDTFSGDNVAFSGYPHGIGLNQDKKEVEYFAGKQINF